MSRAAQKLSRELRHGETGFLEERRAAAALSLVSMAALGVVALYQLGLTKRLPEPRLPGLNARAVHSSGDAYALLETPDAVLGLGSYAATLGLAAMGGADRAERQPWIPLLHTAKALGDAAFAALLARRSWSRHRAFSVYSLITALATFLTLPTTLAEARAALQALRRVP